MFCCLILAGVGGLWAFEWTGNLARRVERELSSALGLPVSVGSARFQWRGPLLILDDVRLGPEGRLGQLASVLVELRDWAQLSVGVERVFVEGGALDLPAWSKAETAATARNQARRAPARAWQLAGMDLRLTAALGAPDARELCSADVLLDVAADGALEFRASLRPTRIEPDAPAGSLFASGRRSAEGALDCELRAQALELTTPLLEACGLWPAQRKPQTARGVLALWSRLEQSPAGRVTIEANLELTDGRCQQPSIDELSWAGHVSAQAASWRDLERPQAWELEGHGRGRWNESQWEARARLFTAPNDQPAWKLRVATGELALERGLLEALGAEHDLGRTWDALEPRGSVALTIHAEGVVGAPQALERALLSLDFQGRAGATYHGWIAPEGHPEGGLPLPTEGLAGRAHVAFDAAQAQPLSIALCQLTGTVLDQGRVSVDGVVIPPRVRPARAALDLTLDSQRIPVDGRLLEAMEHLPELREDVRQFAAQAGELDARARLRASLDQPFLDGLVAAQLRGVSASWAGLPLALRELAGTVQVQLDPSSATAVSFDLAGRTATSESAHLRGRLQGDPAKPRARPAGAGSVGAGPPELTALRFSLNNTALRGSDRDVVAESFPGVEEALQTFGASGKVDLGLDFVQHGAGRFLARLEIIPRQVRLTPEAFSVESKAVRGRVIVLANESTRQGGPTSLETRVAPLVGEWSRGAASVALQADFPTQGSSRLRLAGAGIDVSDRNLVAALKASLGSGTSAYRGLDLTALRVQGRVDFAGLLDYPKEGPGESVYRVFLRRNDFDAGAAMGAGAAFGLKDLRGILLQTGDVLEGIELRATLGRVPVRLNDVRLEPRPDGLRMEAGVAAAEFPLDAEHLRYFLDDKTIAALTGRLGLRGALEVRAGKLLLEPSRLGGLRTSFSGDIRARETQIDLGLPLRAQSASVELKGLVYEGDHVRAWAEISDLVGSLGGRELADGRIQWTYVEPRLSLLEVDVRCEDGRLRQWMPAQAAGGAAVPAFAVDLVEPFPFELALSLSRADVGGLLRGLFESEFASSGRLSGELRLAGDLRQVTRIHGDGRLDLQDSILWSIPVVRDLLAQFGLDESAVFERIRTRFVVRDGVVRMPVLDVYSPLLALEGRGSMDFDGRLAHDFEMRYGLVDKLGPLTQMLYWIQRGLLTVSVRGDMARPRVLLRGFLSFVQRNKSERRELPLPSLAPLPRRF